MRLHFPYRRKGRPQRPHRPTAFQFSVCTLKLCNSWHRTLQSAPFIAHVSLNESLLHPASTAFKQTPKNNILYLFLGSISKVRWRQTRSPDWTRQFVYSNETGDDGMQLFSLVIALWVQKCVDERRPAADTAVSCIILKWNWSIWKVSKATKASAVQRLLQFGVRKNGSDYKPNLFLKALAKKKA